MEDNKEFKDAVNKLNNNNKAKTEVKKDKLNNDAGG